MIRVSEGKTRVRVKSTPSCYYVYSVLNILKSDGPGIHIRSLVNPRGTLRSQLYLQWKRSNDKYAPIRTSKVLMGPQNTRSRLVNFPYRSKLKGKWTIKDSVFPRGPGLSVVH